MICGMCRGQLGLLGVLGSRKHYQCRNCGAAYSKKIKPKKEKTCPSTPRTKPFKT